MAVWPAPRRWTTSYPSGTWLGGASTGPARALRAPSLGRAPARAARRPSRPRRERRTLRRPGRWVGRCRSASARRGRGAAAHRLERVVGTHREVVADRHERDVDAVAGHEGEVGEQRRVAGVEDRDAAHAHDDAHRRAAVRAVGEAARVPGGREGDSTEGEVGAPADVHADTIDAVGREVAHHLDRSDHGRPAARRDRHRVADVVAVGMRQHDVARRQRRRVGDRERVAAQERVDEHLVVCGLEPDTGVPEERQLHGTSPAPGGRRMRHDSTHHTHRETRSDGRPAGAAARAQTGRT
jgi:hypothetical protein